ncbi:FKBP-type peptidyl-prolyl cis-trans isomerase [Pseudohongiella sp. SYSU M77423]|uniref:FKBP-type peptidyl-prolyl cis-trans isomerase N-terminal domain-containing protein n=1 Tax=Pseudohongiella sp. SYSU M77423 TaxID=3042312 RepID=UPI0024808DAE|nr:FKBP-type peptidyl-prolyl cis-trans isomerase [Pseudohongiella sp. SYSU M77423]MDH7944925.1 FKBP-type peptidyl-prolyl cis-trans isomerase [Pseudohongiella sp. SYSU M77423]
MQTLRASSLGLAVSLLMVNAPVHAQDIDLTDQDTQISYSVGVNIGQNLMMQGLTDQIDIDAFIAGLRDMVNGEPQMTEDEMMNALMTFQQQLMDEQQAQVEASRAESEAFLAENAQREGVMTTESGLQYEVLERGDGSGVSPTATDTVTAHYEGRFIDGEVFDSSIARGEPAEFALNQVIPGWTEGLQLMQTGDTYRLYIPSDLGYGPGGSGPIPPFATLVFDVELLEVNGQ